MSMSAVKRASPQIEVAYDPKRIWNLQLFQSLHRQS